MPRKKIEQDVVEDARQLFMDGWTQRDIARFLGTTEKTVSNWKEKHNWDKLRIDIRSVSENVYDILAYQMQMMRQQKDDAIAKGEIYRVDKGDLDALHKLHLMVKKPDLKFAQLSGIIKGLIEYVMLEDLELAKRLKPIVHRYILEQQKIMSNQ